MNRKKLLIVSLVVLISGSPVHAISRKTAFVAATAVGAGSFAGMWKFFFEEPLPSLNNFTTNSFYKKDAVRVGGAASFGVSALTGFILYQYTPGPRYVSVKSMLRPIEINSLAAMRLDTQNVGEAMESSNCFDGTFVIPLISASQQLEVMGVILDQASEELIIAQEDEPDGTSLKYKITALLDDVNRMKKNVAFNKRFLKSMPGWREALDSYNQQLQVNNQSTIAEAAKLQSQAAQRSSWSLVFMTIADFLDLFSRNSRR